MYATAAPGSAEQYVAQHYIKWYQKVTKSTSSTTLGAADNVNALAVKAITEGTSTAGVISAPSTGARKLSAVMRGEVATVKPKVPSVATSKFSYTAREVTTSRAFPSLEGVVVNRSAAQVGSYNKMRRMRWRGTDLQRFKRMNGTEMSTTLDGRAHEILFTNTRNPIRIVVTDGETGNVAIKGKVRIYIDKPNAKVTKRDIEEAMQAMNTLGLETTAATALDMEAMYIMKNVDAAYPQAVAGGRGWKNNIRVNISTDRR